MLIAAWCGLRRGEIIGLQVVDVDLVANQLWVRRAREELLESDDARDKDPKTESRMFGGFYDSAPVSQRPKYGSLNHRAIALSPVFGPRSVVRGGGTGEDGCASGARILRATLSSGASRCSRTRVCRARLTTHDA